MIKYSTPNGNRALKKVAALYFSIVFWNEIMGVPQAMVAAFIHKNT
ncbi:hypothetical protein [Desulforegula conservatrix]|nr:hypothetical protein [Desulforegula conservatrix]